jgi:hypothetical protein
VCLTDTKSKNPRIRWTTPSDDLQLAATNDLRHARIKVLHPDPSTDYLLRVIRSTYVSQPITASSGGRVFLSANVPFSDIPLPNARRQKTIELDVQELRRKDQEETLDLGEGVLEDIDRVPVLKVDKPLKGKTSFGIKVEIPAQYFLPKKGRRPSRRLSPIVFHDNSDAWLTDRKWGPASQRMMRIELVSPTPEQLNIDEITFDQVTRNVRRASGPFNTKPFRWKVRVPVTTWVPVRHYTVKLSKSRS